MGTWAAAIFADDAACDIRDALADCLADGMAPEAAARTLIAQWQPDNAADDGGVLFWIALSAAQVQFGALTEMVRQRARAVISAGGDVQAFETEKGREARRTALARLDADLQSPPRRNLEPRTFRAHINQWPVGLNLSYRLPSGRFCLFRVVGHSDRPGERSRDRHANVVPLDWVGDEVPDAWSAIWLRPRRTNAGRIEILTLLGAEMEARFRPQRLRQLPLPFSLRRQGLQYIPMPHHFDETLAELFGLD